MLNPVMCETADDVLRVAREVCERRLSSLLPVKNPKPKEGKLVFRNRINVVCDRDLALADLWIMTTGQPYEPKPVFVTEASIRNIQKEVCRAFNVDLSDMLSKRRGWSITIPRHVAVVLCRALTKNTLLVIGRMFNRDHTTVLNSCEKYDWLLVRLRAELDASFPLSTWADRSAQLIREDQQRKACMRMKVVAPLRD